MSEKVITYNNLAEFKNKADETYQGRLTAGANITIDENNVISAQGGGGGGSYEGVSPIVVDNDAGTIGADTVQMKFQQITHDDTLVHMASDSNYALGVNIDLLKRLLGVDETVLYEFPLVDNTTQPGTFVVSENIQNFEYIRMHVFHGHSSGTWYTNGWAWAFAFPQGAKRFDLVIPAADGTSNLIFDRQFFTCSDGVTFSRGNKQRHNMMASSVSASALAPDFIITKIVGVNRIGGSN